MPKPVCVPCQRFYRPRHNGTHLLEGMPAVPHAEPGTSHPENWQPYKVWKADLWRCDGCGHQIIAGFGAFPMWEKHHPGKMPHVNHKVNDC